MTGIDDAWSKVREFHLLVAHPVATGPTALTSGRRETRASWLRQEIDEFAATDAIEDQADAMIDLVYFALGTLVEMGVRPTPLFEIVHAANMAKVETGDAPHYSEDGKVTKPDGWIDPRDRIARAIADQADE